MRKITGAIITVLLALVIISCGNTQLTTLWRDPSYSAPPLKKIMVIAFRRDQVDRRMWEDAMVTAIEKQKTTADVVPSYQFFPNEIPQPDAVDANVKDSGFDGVLVVYKVERDTLTNQISGYVANEPVTEYSRRWRMYVTRYEDVYHPPYTDTSLAISVRTDLLLPKGAEGQLVWSATSKSINPTSHSEFRNDVAGIVARQLAKSHMIP